VPDMVHLLRDFTVDPLAGVGADNPLRQVILNTHSPDVARQLNEDQVLFVEPVDGPEGRHARVRPVAGTWRGDEGSMSPERLYDFLGGAPLARPRPLLAGALWTRGQGLRSSLDFRNQLI